MQINRTLLLQLLQHYAYKISVAEGNYLIFYWGYNEEHFDNLPHKHSFYEICYVVNGRGHYIEEDVVYPVSRGTFFCTRPGRKHQIKSKEGMFIYYVAFELDQKLSSHGMASTYQDMYSSNKIVVDHAEHTPAAMIWNALVNQCSEPNKLKAESIICLVQSLLLSFYPLFIDKSESNGIPLVRNKSFNVLMKNVTRYIKDNLSENLKLEETASYFHLSGRHLSRLFQHEYGQSFKAYIQSERIKQAKQLLQNTDLSIQEVSERVGIPSIHYFSTFFKKLNGVSPNQFRKENV
jgi:YesN/AraC family two-component response regulator